MGLRRASWPSAEILAESEYQGSPCLCCHRVPRVSRAGLGQSIPGPRGYCVPMGLASPACVACADWGLDVSLLVDGRPV